jgi:hypothetical protein
MSSTVLHRLRQVDYLSGKRAMSLRRGGGLSGCYPTTEEDLS